MVRRFKHLNFPEDRGPLRVMFVHTEVVVGGAETLLAEIMRNMNPDQFHVELCCLKRLAELGEILAGEITTHVGLLNSKYDFGVLSRLTGLLRDRRVDAVITVGTGGDRMFWGRLAAWRANIPVVLSALHSTGYPQQVERANRMLSPITDGFIGCARLHSRFLVEGERCPANKVFTIYNGVDVKKFSPHQASPLRIELGIPEEAPVAGIVAALRPEKQHGLLLEAMRLVVDQRPDAHLVIIGDGVERTTIEHRRASLGLQERVHLTGTRHDVPRLLPALNVKVLSSKMEANPASTLEAAACGLPVVAPHVGSLPETVEHGKTGLLYPGSNHKALAAALLELLNDPARARAMGDAGRQLVCSRFSMESMVRGYELLVDGIYRAALKGKRLTPETFDSIYQRQEPAHQLDGSVISS